MAGVDILVGVNLDRLVLWVYDDFAVLTGSQCTYIDVGQVTTLDDGIASTVETTQVHGVLHRILLASSGVGVFSAYLLDLIAVERPSKVGFPVYRAKRLVETGRELDTLVVYSTTVYPHVGVTR